MTESHVDDFHAHGFATHLRCMPRSDMQRYYDEVSALTASPSGLWSRADVDKMRATRNRHLDSLAVLELATHPRILDVVQPLLGPDILLWRSDFFVQGRSDPETMWHQDRQFSGPRRIPSIVLADERGAPVPALPENEMRGGVPMPANISVWLAISDTDRRTGCVMVVDGSHKQGVIPVRPARPGEKPIFGKATVLDHDIRDEDVRYMELEAGEFFVFDRLTLHASVPTQSDAPRIGLSLRFTSPDVLVYPDCKDLDGHGFPVENYRVLQVRGRDTTGYNAALVEAAEQRRAQLAR